MYFYQLDSNINSVCPWCEAWSDFICYWWCSGMELFLCEVYIYTCKHKIFLSCVLMLFGIFAAISPMLFETLCFPVCFWILVC